MRNYQPILEVAKTVSEHEVPQIVYHRYCRNVFTANLKRVLESKEEPSSEEAVPDKRVRLERSSSESRVYKNKCIFCQKTKYKKGTNTLETLTQAQELRADKTLRERATKTGDSRIISLTSRDNVTAEAHYHWSCYRDYTRPDSKQSSKEVSEDPDSDPYQAAVEYAYESLVQYIKEELMTNPDAVPLVTLTDKLKDFISSRGFKDVKDSTKKYVRQKLEGIFGDELLIFPDEKGKLLVLPNNLDRQELARRNQMLKKELAVWRSNTMEMTKLLEKAALYIRQSVKEHQMNAPWPLAPADLTTLKACIPDDLHHFFTVLLTGDPTNTTPSARVCHLSDSMSQDIVFDTYKPLSIKYNERTKRARAGVQVQNIAPGQKIKQW